MTHDQISRGSSAGWEGMMGVSVCISNSSKEQMKFLNTRVKTFCFLFLQQHSCYAVSISQLRTLNAYISCTDVWCYNQSLCKHLLSPYKKLYCHPADNRSLQWQQSMWQERSQIILSKHDSCSLVSSATMKPTAVNCNPNTSCSSFVKFI